MIVTKRFAGTCTVGSSVKRTMSYGGSYAASTYSTRLDALNEMIASFLRDDCGVSDVAYEARGAHTEKYVWIYGVPFLWYCASTSLYFCVPFHSSYLTYTTCNVFSGASTGVYDFYLGFAGSPKNGFILRFKSYQSTSYNSSILRIWPATNMVTGGDAVMFTRSGCSANIIANTWVRDIVDGVPADIAYDATETGCTQAIVGLDTLAIHAEACDNKFPLVPVIAGIWQAKGVYQHPNYFGVPAAVTAVTESQVEFLVGNKKFMSTVLDAGTATSHIGIGLIDVTDD